MTLYSIIVGTNIYFLSRKSCFFAKPHNITLRYFLFSYSFHAIVLSCSQAKTACAKPQKRKYTGDSKRTQYRNAKKAKEKSQAALIKTLPKVTDFFSPPNIQPDRNSHSLYASKNNTARAVQQTLQSRKKAPIKRQYNSTAGHVQNVTGGCVKKRRQSLSVSRKVRKQKLARKTVNKQSRSSSTKTSSWPREHVERAIIRINRIIRSCRRASISVSALHHTILLVLETCLENAEDTADGAKTISIHAAGKKLNIGWRKLKHVGKFLKDLKVPLSSNRGGKRLGRSLLDDVVFKERVSLWVNEQTAKFTAKRLRGKGQQSKSQVIML